MVKIMHNYKKTEEMVLIDEGILPLISTLNHWTMHKDWHFTGIATTFSCEGHEKDETYVSLHCSKYLAEKLARHIASLATKYNWKFTFSYGFRLALEGNYSETEKIEAINELTKHLKTFTIPSDDCGWRIFPRTAEHDLLSIIDANIDPFFEQITTDIMDYLISNKGSMNRKQLMLFMCYKYSDRGKVRRAYDRLLKYGLITHENYLVQFTGEQKETTIQTFRRCRAEFSDRLKDSLRRENDI